MKYKILKLSLARDLCTDSREEGLGLSEYDGPINQITRLLGDPEMVDVRKGILNNVNGPFYGLDHKVTDVQRAILIMGSIEVRRYFSQEIKRLENQEDVASVS